MTMNDVRSIEETLIKVSVRTLYFIGAALVVGTCFAVMLYASLVQGQEMILAEVKKNALERQYQILDIRKDVTSLDKRVAKLEEK